MPAIVLVVIWTNFVGQTTYSTYRTVPEEDCEQLKAQVLMKFTAQERKIDFIGCVREGEIY